MARLHLIRDAVRAREIAAIFLKYRFDEVLAKIETPAAWLAKMAPPVRGPLSLWRRIRLAVEELGPAFIKAAQILSTRPDILPPGLLKELSLLRSHVRAIPFAEIEPILNRELGGPWQDTFTMLDATPVAAGSIGQIHRGRLKGSDREVAVKVQRPGIRKTVETDLEIVAWFAHQMHKNLPGLRPFDLPTVVNELQGALRSELDFQIEGRNAELFNALNRYPDEVFAPEVIERFTTSQLLVTEWIDGRPPEVAQVSAEEAQDYARKGGESFFAQIVQTGFFHGDPHAGNLLITTDGRCCFIDWGLAGQLTQQMRYDLVDLFAACNERNAPRVTRIALRMGRGTQRIDRNRLERAITATLFRYEEELRTMDQLGQVILALIYVFGSHGIHVARDYTLLAKAVISIEQTAKGLDPGFNLARVGQPFVRQITWERWNPPKLARNAVSELRDKFALLMELPEDMRRVLHRLEDRDLGMELHHKGLEGMGGLLNAAFSRLALAIVTGCLIVGSALIIHAGLPPKLWGYPAVGLFGFVLSGVMGLYLIVDTLRGGRWR